MKVFTMIEKAKPDGERFTTDKQYPWVTALNGL